MPAQGRTQLRQHRDLGLQSPELWENKSRSPVMPFCHCSPREPRPRPSIRTGTSVMLWCHCGPGSAQVPVVGAAPTSHQEGPHNHVAEGSGHRERTVVATQRTSPVEWGGGFVSVSIAVGALGSPGTEQGTYGSIKAGDNLPGWMSLRAGFSSTVPGLGHKLWKSLTTSDWLDTEILSCPKGPTQCHFSLKMKVSHPQGESCHCRQQHGSPDTWRGEHTSPRPPTLTLGSFSPCHAPVS